MLVPKECPRKSASFIPGYANKKCEMCLGETTVQLSEKHEWQSQSIMTMAITIDNDNDKRFEKS